MRRMIAQSLGLAATVLALAASQATAQDAVRLSGAYYYERHCADCHGADGRGSAIGFPLVGRPAGPLDAERIIESLRLPLLAMPRFDRATISDDVAKLIAFHIGVLDNKASNAALPAPPQISASALRNPPNLTPPPTVAPAPPASYEMQEYASPCGPGADIGIAPDGRIWFTAIEQNALSVFDPRNATFRCFPLPARNSRPHGLAIDRDGFVFITLTGLPVNKVAMFDPQTELFVEYQMPAKPQPLVYPHTITFDADRNPMFTLEHGDAVGRIDRRSGVVQLLTIPTRYARPAGITASRNGHVLVAEDTGNKLFDYDPRGGKAVEYVHPRAAEDPALRALAADSRNAIWFAEYEFGSIGTFDPRTQRWRSFRAPANGGEARRLTALTVDGRDVVWFAHHGGNYIGRFDPRNESFAVYPHQSKDMNCRALEIGKDGALWCMGSGAAMLMRLVIK